MCCEVQHSAPRYRRQLARAREEIAFRDDMLAEKDKSIQDLQIRGLQYQHAMRDHDSEKLQLQVTSLRNPLQYRAIEDGGNSVQDSMS